MENQNYKPQFHYFSFQIFSFLIIPLHIIINPIILILFTINSNFNSKKILIKIKELVNCLKDNNNLNNNK